MDVPPRPPLDSIRRRERKPLKTKDASAGSLSGAHPCLSFLGVNFLLNSKGPRKTAPGEQWAAAAPLTEPLSLSPRPPFL